MNLKAIFPTIIVCTLLLISSAFAESTDVSRGKISKMVPAKKEIYVMTDAGKMEYYFKENTKVEKSGTKLSYEDLREGMEVEVTATKVGKRLDPVKVEILAGLAEKK